MIFRLPLPPSVNNLFATVPARGKKKARRVHSRSYSAWRVTAGKEISVQRQAMPTKRVGGAYKLLIVADWRERTASNGRGRDLGNFEKAVSDALVWMNIIDDDSLAEEIHLRWGDVVGCEVTVEAIG